MRIWVILAALILILTLATGAQAQISKTTPPDFPSMQHVFETLSPAMQEELLAEVDTARALCMQHPIFSIYQDCECIGVKFLDARLVIGPEQSLNNVLNIVSRQCTNTPAIAGYQHKLCMERMGVYVFLKPEDMEEFCACIGNQVAEGYARAPANSILYKKNLTVAAHQKCDFDRIMRNEQLERQRYDERRNNVIR